MAADDIAIDSPRQERRRAALGHEPVRWFVIMGAAVRPGGAPSGALRRRVETALEAARGWPQACFLPTGAVGRHPPSEAAVMRELLVGAGVPPERIVLEEKGTDTLSSVVHCARILRAEPAPLRVSVCTHDYHLPRCRLLFRAFGLRVEGVPLRGARAALGTRRWLVALAREIAGSPWDLALALGRRARDSS
jgi:uncharacterized SAM-binding protein YcdF (DUF218 family)